ncbi:uncharacterized protein METZ01_LOCUS351240 [marine metagenome]|uniref:Uncharacterized protein n=1 Tax=marine metagenome TaxID=408172 RepID=A0A382RL78_9ZZZZ
MFVAFASGSIRLEAEAEAEEDWLEQVHQVVQRIV